MSLALLADAPCSDCGALLERGQRYCVHCGRRRQDVEDPAIAWLASRYSPDQSSSVTAVAAAPPARNPLALPALALAVLPLAVGVGVLVGHRGDGGTSDQQLLEALRNQKAPVVKVGSVAGTAAASHTAVAHAKKAAVVHHRTVGKKDKSGGKVVARTKYGV